MAVAGRSRGLGGRARAQFLVDRTNVVHEPVGDIDLEFIQHGHHAAHAFVHTRDHGGVGGVAVTARRGFGPFAPGFRAIPFGDADALQAAITPNTVGFLVEPIQGEAGVIIPRDGYLRAVREICSRENVMLILDEIQTGFGRTGKLLAEEHEGIEADLTLIGKALSGGFYPVSAVLSNSEVLGVLKPGEHGSTFGGNPLACRIARMALRVLVEEGMIENAERMGAYFLGQLKSIRNNMIKDVRGRGPAPQEGNRA